MANFLIFINLGVWEKLLYQLYIKMSQSEILMFIMVNADTYSKCL